METKKDWNLQKKMIFMLPKWLSEEDIDIHVA